jgi:hypothetical protein
VGSVLTPAAPPLAPTGLQASTGGASRVTLTWPAAMERGAAVSHYTLEMCPVPPATPVGSLSDLSGGTAACKFSLTWSGDKLSADVKGLNPNAAYLFRVQAHSKAGVSEYSPMAHANTGPAAPSALLQAPRVEFSSADSLRVGWDIPADNGSPITGYRFRFVVFFAFHPAHISMTYFILRVLGLNGGVTSPR